MKFNDAFRNYILDALKKHNLPHITVSVTEGLPEDEKLYQMLINISKHFETTINGDILIQAQLNSVAQKKHLGAKPSKQEEPTKIPDVFLKAFTDDENLT